MHNRNHLFGFIPLPNLAEITAALAFQSAVGATPTIKPTYATQSPILPATYSPSRILPTTSPTLPTYQPTVRPTSSIPTKRPTLHPILRPTNIPTSTPIQPSNGNPTPFPAAALVKIHGDSISSNSIKPGEISVIKVYGIFADGVVRNITRDVIVESSNPNVLSVTQEYTDDGELILRGLSVGWSIVQYRINNFYSKPNRITVWPQQGCFYDYAPDYPAYN